MSFVNQAGKTNGLDKKKKKEYKEKKKQIKFGLVR